MKVGDRVKIIDGTQFYYQARGIVGVVVELGVDENQDGEWVAVHWEPGAIRNRDNYPIKDLINLDEKHEFPEDDFSENQIAIAEEIIRGMR